MNHFHIVGQIQPLWNGRQLITRYENSVYFIVFCSTYFIAIYFTLPQTCKKSSSWLVKKITILAKLYSWFQYCIVLCREQMENLIKIVEPYLSIKLILTWFFALLDNNELTDSRLAATVITSTASKMCVFGVFLVRIFPHLDWIQGDTAYLFVFSPNSRKYGLEKLQIRTLVAQCSAVPKTETSRKCDGKGRFYVFFQ